MDRVVKRRKQVRREDLTRDHMDLIAKASMIPQDHFLCFGRYYYVLYGLNLVDKENQLTLEGRSMARAWIQHRALEDERREREKAKASTED